MEQQAVVITDPPFTYRLYLNPDGTVSGNWTMDSAEFGTEPLQPRCWISFRQVRSAANELRIYAPAATCAFRVLLRLDNDREQFIRAGVQILGESVEIYSLDKAMHGSSFEQKYLKAYQGGQRHLDILEAVVSYLVGNL